MFAHVGELLFGAQQLSQEALYDRLQERFFLPYKHYFRFAIPESGELLTAAQEQAYRALGMLDAIEPSVGQAYDFCVLPGGVCAVTAMLIRFMLEQMVVFGIAFPRLIFLGSDRQLVPGELWQLRRYDRIESFSKERPESEMDMIRSLWRNAASLLNEERGTNHELLNRALRTVNDTVRVDFIHCAALNNSSRVGTVESFAACIQEAIASNIENPRVLLVAAQPYIRYQLCVLLNQCRVRGYNVQCLNAVGPEASAALRGPEHLGNALATLLHEERLLQRCPNQP